MFDHLYKEQKVIREAPIAVALFVTLGFGLGYWVASERLTVAQERIQNAQERLENATEKNQELIDALESKGEAVKDRLKVKPSKVKFTVTEGWNANTVIEVFEKAGWTVETLKGPPDQPIEIFSDANSLNEIMAAFAAAGVSYEKEGINKIVPKSGPR